MEEITFENVITYRNFFEALKDCNRNVRFKYSVQEYNARAANYITETIRGIRAGKIPEVKNTKPILIYERGKQRVITPIDIRDRVIQKVLCEKVLIPSIMPHLIYDNGASIKNKGVRFARNRLNLFIEQAKREYGPDKIYALVFDFKSYFDSIPHKECNRVIRQYVRDERLADIIIGIIESYQRKEIEAYPDPAKRDYELKRLKNHERKGICLGSQISQVMAVAVPNGFDHFIKDTLKLKYYERYMDDGIILLDDKEKLWKIKRRLESYASSIGLKLSSKKTYVVKATKGFTFMKVKYRICGNRTVKRLSRDGIVRERRKLKAFKKKVANGRMSRDDVYNNVQSWTAHTKGTRSYRTMKSMFDIYDREYGGYRMTRKWYRAHPEAKRKRKAVRI